MNFDKVLDAVVDRDALRVQIRLTEERLAQAERDRDDWRKYAHDANLKLSDTEDERDEWRARHEQVSAEQKDLMNRIYTLRDERDAALVKAEQWERDYTSARESERQSNEAEYHAVTARDAALKKANAAEKESMRVHAMLLEVEVQASRAEDAEASLADLHARIEALVVKYASMAWLVAELRALTEPAKEETALDVLSRIEAQMSDPSGPGGPDVDDMAKLRTLIEKESSNGT